MILSPTPMSFKNAIDDGVSAVVRLLYLNRTQQEWYQLLCS